MVNCNVIVSCPSRYRVDKDVIRKSIEKTLEGQKVYELVEVEVSIVGERTMSSLHKKYLETYEATDVMSFPLEFAEFPDGTKRLGDIVVCYPVAVREAAKYGRSISSEIGRLVEHGCLHLLGIHHD